jgi:hypothetical protein
MEKTGLEDMKRVILAETRTKAISKAEAWRFSKGRQPFCTKLQVLVMH